jgi:hypothetical protein
MPSRTMKNRYAKRARVSERQVRALVRCFAADLTALQTAQLSGLNRNTVNRLYRGLRDRLQAACEAQRPLFGVVEVDESWFGARNIRGKRGRGAYGKTIVFGIFERAGQVYTEVVPDCSRATPGACRRLFRHQLRWLARLQRPGRSWLRPPAHRPRKRRVRQRLGAHQRHRRLLGSRQGPPRQVQGRPQTHLPSPSQGDRVALQQPTCQQVQDPANLAAQKTPSARQDPNGKITGAFRGLGRSCIDERRGLKKNTGHTLRSRNTRSRSIRICHGRALVPYFGH